MTKFVQTLEQLRHTIRLEGIKIFAVNAQRTKSEISNI